MPLTYVKTSDPRTEEIRKQNDRFRTQVISKNVDTRTLKRLSPRALEEVIHLVRNFESFAPQWDILGEHATGAFVYNKTWYVFHIEYFFHPYTMDPKYENPADLTMTYRALCVMTANEFCIC